MSNDQDLHRDARDRACEEVARYFALLAEPMRVKILHAVCAGDRSVGEIVSAIDATQTNVSRHLAYLHRAGVLRRSKRGNFVIYSVSDPGLLELCRQVCMKVAGESARLSEPATGLRSLASDFGRRA
ncbi:MAG: ArsR/SmtB family transcription factor [Betaproteobacteria bacterium]